MLAVSEGDHMSRETDWAVFEKAVEVTASAVRGTMGADGSQPASYVGDVFREIHKALKEAASEMPDKAGTTGFAAKA
jgi:hypothetical protein